MVRLLFIATLLASSQSFATNDMPTLEIRQFKRLNAKTGLPEIVLQQKWIVLDNATQKVPSKQPVTIEYRDIPLVDGTVP